LSDGAMLLVGSVHQDNAGEGNFWVLKWKGFYLAYF